MKITRAHVTFYCHKKCPASYLSRRTPSGHDQVPSVHTLINSQVPHPPWDRSDPNTITLLMIARRNDPVNGLLATLERCAKSPGTVLNPQRRAANCRKWLVRINEERV